MSILKGIKQFVQNLLNVTKLPESTQYNRKFKAEEKNQFKNKLRINLNNLLKSEGYTGTKCISEMFILLGVDLKLATNPIVLAQIEQVFLENIPQTFAKEIREGHMLYKKDIIECVKYVKNNSQLYQTIQNNKKQKNFTINKDGTITEKGTIGDNILGERKYSISEEKLIIEENYYEEFYNKAPVNHQKKYVYNNMNILMERIDIYADIKEDGNLSSNLVKDIRKRDNDYPFIIYHSVQDKNNNSCENIYSIICASNICSMEYDFLAIGQKINNKEEIGKYYQNNKKDILDILVACAHDDKEDEKGRKPSDMYKFAANSLMIGKDCRSAHERKYGKEL